MKFFKTQSAIRLLIFDLDGTLIDSKVDLAVSVNAALRHMGRPPLDDQTIYRYVGEGAQALIGRALGEGVTEAEIQQGLEFFLTYYRHHKLDNTTLYPGVREALPLLANGNGCDQRVLAVLTNKPVHPSRDILRQMGLLSLFHCVYGGNSFETKKPDPLGMHAILQETNFPPEAAMIVGDSDVDVQTGKNAGVWTCGVTYGFGNLELDSNPPHLLVHSFPELAEILNPAIRPLSDSDRI